MGNDNIKDKIRKLLALSQDNPSDAESYSALQKAQELMALHKLSELDLEDAKKQECIQKKTIIGYSRRSSDSYRNELATIIADNFCCVNYLSTPRGTQTHYIAFMGLEDDVAISEEVLYAADAAIIRGYNRVYKDMCKEYYVDYMPAKYFNPAKCGYIEGYLDGLKIALESQKEKNQEWGLVLVTPQEAIDYLASLNHMDGRDIQVDNTYYDAGYNDGSNFHLNKKIANNKQDMIAE